MDKDRLKDLIIKRRKKYQDYQKIPASSWKKRTKKFEFDILDIKIKIEKLKGIHE